MGDMAKSVHFRIFYVLTFCRCTWEIDLHEIFLRYIDLVFQANGAESRQHALELSSSGEIVPN